ncbi:BlaI/MecI/CopY family transcriptional regulator [Rhodanobacter glycinis]|jgi:predicted transcriptional regulator|uniref:BlaI/MecI/CopY family transcriptional regulator n=1 Tax=Rhodanobacter glycinis TaxID=582702 RepID=A0A502FQ77_9GAMM|nr:BlaI/MecI/CopY family transcriptional regulator [Rhodanobacter glycinis]TPG10618.1 BlaI/MecI/CopY family transcriptional regulator [Rhodanobacter glycinis]TPG51173.1 BlaI/MecI/CopY family transcriptional regulator [Rhodanobacter glycinis]
MPNKQIAISDAESRVMDVLWQRAPQTSEDIVATLLEPTGWHEKTIRTLLNRLLGKGAVSAQKDGRRYLYTPLLRREVWQQQESRSLLDRVFGGKVAPLLTHFSQHEKLSTKEVAELRKLIDAIEKKGR